jgi:hypothetical protein
MERELRSSHKDGRNQPKERVATPIQGTGHDESEKDKERVEGGARQLVSYKYETMLRIKTSNFPI